MDKEEQIKEIAHIIASEQCSQLPRIDTGGRTFTVRGGLSYEVIKAVAERIYQQGFRK